MSTAAERAIQNGGRALQQRLDLRKQDGNVVGAYAPGWGCSDRAHTQFLGPCKRLGRVMLVTFYNERQAMAALGKMCICRVVADL